MLQLALKIFQEYGVEGLIMLAIIIGIIINVRLFKLLFDNHLKHMSDDIKENTQETKNLKEEVIVLKERVSSVEGQLKA